MNARFLKCRLRSKELYFLPPAHLRAVDTEKRCFGDSEVYRQGAGKASRATARPNRLFVEI